ncbi:MAG: tetratricopeptide repeat protein [Novosphingobium sp.]
MLLTLILPLLVSAEPTDSWAVCMDAASDSAVAACTRLLSEDEALARYNRANAWRELAFRYKAQAKAPDGPDPLGMALADYDRALVLRPGFAEALVNRGVAHAERRDFLSAIADYDAAIALRPDLAEAWNNRSLAWHRAGHYDRALKDFDQTIRLNKNYGNALINRALPSLRP